MDFPPPTKKQANLIWIALYGLAIAAIIGLLVLLVWGVGQLLGLLSPVLWPLAVGGLVLLSIVLPAFVSYRRRERGTARS